MTTVHDVAALSGVSIATVSRTLRAPHRVSEGTRERVLAAVRELDYRPNRAAINLRGGRTGAIALVVPDIANPYFAALTKGAQAAARARGFGLVVVDTTEDAGVERDEVASLRSEIDGMILVSSRLDDGELEQIASWARCVLINRSLPGVPSVTLDEVAAARAAIDHLAGLGHRRIAYVGGPTRSWSEARRWRALRDAADDAHVSVQRIGGHTPDARGGRDAAGAALAQQASAVIAYNDLVALGLLAGWAEAGVRVPRDMSLLGFDDTFVAELSSPPLTSVGADLGAVGEAAVALLLARIDGETTQPVSSPMTLSVRSSTAPVD
ncbi:LacI family DNA-binding transcriptional regulator [Microbacterium protaetiae]|nr:LacI family DNA-binding transcriptional regulator [Microbacterium protaetiae]